MSNNATAKVTNSGYDLAVYGLENGSFYYIHVPALICIFLSFTCVVITLTLSFKRKGVFRFFNWSKSERFVVYLALCDGGYNIFHFVDHLHIVIVKNHVYPKQLCEFYGFTLAVFIMGQVLMVDIVAVNAFMLMYFNKNLKFGQRDWKLLTWTLGVPFIGATIAGILGQLGPNGTFCFFDGVKGVTTNICFTTVPLLIIFTMNITMYILTWTKIRQRTKALLQSSRGQHSASSTHRSAKAMSLFVLAFFIQWWSLALFGVWALISEVPQTVFHFVTTFTNLGGCLNLLVYIILVKMGLTGKMLQSFTKKPSTNDSKLQQEETGN